MLLILGVCAAVYGPRLGTHGLSMSEGHRAIPGWEMATSGEWLLPRMFERLYLRKPPGMFWAIAASAKVLGETEFSARAVSALSMTASALLVFFITRRWFGNPGGLAAGLAQALTPLWWLPGRSAEIEALNNTLTQAACLLIADAIVRWRAAGKGVGATGGVGSPTETARATLFTTLGVAISTGGALLVKGPACVSAIGATLLAGLVVARAARAAFRPGVVAGLLVGAGAFGAWLWMAERAIAAAGVDPLAPVVRQSVGDFLYGPGWATKLPLMPIAAIASAMPAALAMLFVFGRDACAERDAGEQARLATNAARLLSMAALLGVGALAAAGVTNPRYAMPALGLIPPVVGYVVWGVLGGFGHARARLARALMLGNPARLGVVMTIAAVVGAQVMESSRARNSGRDAGQVLGALLAQHAAARGQTGVEVWADFAIEARPEVLDACRRTARSLGLDVRARWVALADAPPDQASGAWLLLRSDPEGSELPRWSEGRVAVGEAKAAKFGFVLLAPADPGP